MEQKWQTISLFCLLLIQTDVSKELLRNAIFGLIVLIYAFYYQKMPQEHLKKHQKHVYFKSKWIFEGL